MTESTNTEAALSQPLAGVGRNRISRLWQDIRESIAGSEQDFTEGSLGRAILLLSIPMTLELVMESVFAVVDIFFVAKLGPDAVATVGLTESMLTLVYAVGIGFSMSATAIVARRTGEKDPEGAAVAAVQAIIASVLISLPVTALGVFAAPTLLSLMGASEAVINGGFAYTAIMLGSNLTIMLIFIINAIFRGVGDAAIAMRVLWFANFFNIILDPCLIFGLGPFPELGIKGAAVATAIGRGLGVVFQIYKLMHGSSRIHIQRRHLRVDVKVMLNLLRLSVGGIGQFVIATSSWIGLYRIIAVFGSGALAGYTIAIRIVMFSIMPSWGMSNAAATLVGQNLGAKKPERAEKSVWITAMVNVIFLGGVGILFHQFAETLVRFFTSEPEVVALGAKALRLFSYGYALYAFGMVMTQAFNGAGDTATPTKINFFCFWLFEIPLAYVLAFTLGFAETGVFVSVLAAESMMGIVGILMFRRGRWKTRVV